MLFNVFAVGGGCIVVALALLEQENCWRAEVVESVASFVPFSPRFMTRGNGGRKLHVPGWYCLLHVHWIFKLR